MEKKRKISVEGTYINNVIGYCHCTAHKGALNRKLAYKHKCLAKKCKWLEKYDESQWRKQQQYYNKRRK